LLAWDAAGAVNSLVPISTILCRAGFVSGVVSRGSPAPGATNSRVSGEGPAAVTVWLVSGAGLENFADDRKLQPLARATIRLKTKNLLCGLFLKGLSLAAHRTNIYNNFRYL